MGCGKIDIPNIDRLFRKHQLRLQLQGFVKKQKHKWNLQKKNQRIKELVN
jgi:hypothetical protein